MNRADIQWYTEQLQQLRIAQSQPALPTLTDVAKFMTIAPTTFNFVVDHT